MVPAGTTAGEALRDAGAPTTGPDAIVAARDAQGDLRDLSWAPEIDTEVAAVAASSPDGRGIIRHTCAHVLAQAVQQHFPDAKLGIGPPVTDGFYYDFDVDRPFTPEDLAVLEKTMRKIIKAGQRFSRRVLASVSEAKRELKSEPYKLQLIDLKGSTSNAGVNPGEVMEVGAGELTIYDNVHPHTGEVVWSDLCRGPHVPTTRYIPAFRLTRTAAAYWRGSGLNAHLPGNYVNAGGAIEAQGRPLVRLRERERGRGREEGKL